MNDNGHRLNGLVLCFCFLCICLTNACAPKIVHYNKMEKVLTSEWGEKKDITKATNGSKLYEYQKLISKGKRHKAELGVGGKFVRTDTYYTVYCVHQITVNSAGEIVSHRAFGRQIDTEGPFSRPYEYQTSTCPVRLPPEEEAS
jgi:hypothetical protein